MSKLKTWRIAKKINQTMLSVRAGTTAPTISRVERGDLWPTADLAARIQKATRGAVTVTDLLADYQAAKRNRHHAAE
jgi:transcriptional regulator with XRE-family HTH domain